jgi:hypothetical protein
MIDTVMTEAPGESVAPAPEIIVEAAAPETAPPEAGEDVVATTAPEAEARASRRSSTLSGHCARQCWTRCSMPMSR